MAVQPFQYLVMTDGTDTVTFGDGAGNVTNWPLAYGAFAPTIALLRTAQLGGRGPYADAPEDLSLIIQDTTAALCYSKLDTLTRLLDKADRWWLRGEPIAPVLLKYVPQGSTVHASGGTTLQAIVLGRVAGSGDMLSLVPTLNEALTGWVIEGIRMKILRRGAWTGATDTATAGGGGHATVIATTVAPPHPTVSPIALSWAGFDSTNTAILKAGYLMVGSSSSDLLVTEAEAGTAAKYTSVADVANKARGGSVLRYTPTDALPATSGSISLSGMTPTGPVALYAVIRNNSATTYQIVANVVGSGFTVSTPSFPIDGTSFSLPKIVCLGTVNAVAGLNVTLTITASAASGSLDIDYLIAVNMRDETVSVLAYDDPPNVSTLFGVGIAFTLDVVYDPTADQQPAVRLTKAGGVVKVPLTYRGPLPFLSQKVLTTSIVYALWASTNSAHWQYDNGGGTVVAAVPTVTRYRSYVSPQ